MSYAIDKITRDVLVDEPLALLSSPSGASGILSSLLAGVLRPNNGMLSVNLELAGPRDDNVLGRMVPSSRISGGEGTTDGGLGGGGVWATLMGTSSSTEVTDELCVERRGLETRGDEEDIDARVLELNLVELPATGMGKGTDDWIGAGSRIGGMMGDAGDGSELADMSDWLGGELSVVGRCPSSTRSTVRVGATSSGTVTVRTSILSSLGAVARPFALDSEPNQAGRAGFFRGVDAADALIISSLDCPAVHHFISDIVTEIIGTYE